MSDRPDMTVKELVCFILIGIFGAFMFIPQLHWWLTWLQGFFL